MGRVTLSLLRVTMDHRIPVLGLRTNTLSPIFLCMEYTKNTPYLCDFVPFVSDVTDGVHRRTVYYQ